MRRFEYVTEEVEGLVLQLYRNHKPTGSRVAHCILNECNSETTLEDLRNMSDAELLRWPCFGKRCLMVLRVALGQQPKEPRDWLKLTRKTAA